MNRPTFTQSPPGYAELHALSNFTFLRGASHPEELVEQAHALTAANDVHMHERGRRALQDTLTAVRLGLTVQTAGHALYPNGERRLRRRVDLARIYPAELLSETLKVAERCRFTLDELRYESPQELVPAGITTVIPRWGFSPNWPPQRPTRRYFSVGMRPLVQNAVDALRIENTQLDERVKSSESRAREFREELDKLHARLREATT